MFKRASEGQERKPPSAYFARMAQHRIARHLLIALAVLGAGSLSAGMVGDDRIFRSDAGRTYFRDLLRQGHWGLVSSERAAFIVQRADGSMGCVLWPASGLMDRETFHGRIPSGTKAIIHTHPIAWPLPSEHDRVEAERLGIPIYVLTQRAIYRTDGQAAIALVRDAMWYREIPESSLRCEIGFG